MSSILSSFRDVHIGVKVCCFFICLFSVLFVQQIWFFSILACFFYLFHGSFLLWIVSILCILSNCFFSSLSILSLFVMIYSVIYLFARVVSFSEFRYFVECLFYRGKFPKITLFSLYVGYFFKYYGFYFQEFMLLKNGYGRKFTISLLFDVLSQSLKKTKEKMKDLMRIYQYRFYHSSSSRTYVETYDFSSYDLRYLLLFVIVLAVTFVFGR